MKNKFNKKRYWLGETNTNSHTEINRKFSYNEDLLKHHLIYGEQVLMGVAHLSMAVTLSHQINPHKAILLERISFSNALLLKKHETSIVSVKVEKNGDKLFLNSYYIKNTESVNKQAASHQLNQTNINWKAEKLDIINMVAQEKNVQAGTVFYKHPIQKCYGQTLFTVKTVHHLREGLVLGEMMLTKEMINAAPDYYIHPAIFDACHVISSYTLGQEPALYHRVPLLIKKVSVSPEITLENLIHCYCHAEKVMMNDQIAEMNLKLTDQSGNVLVVMVGFITKVVPSKEALFSDNDRNADKLAKSYEATTEVKPNTYVTEDLDNSIRNYLRDKIAIVLKKKINDIPTTMNFMDLGLDSNNMIGAVREIEEQIGIELYPTLFFEYQNISSLTAYFSKELAKEFRQFFELNKSIQLIQSKQDISKSKNIIKKTNTYQNEEIAVIGMSGYLPQSENLQQFWQHLEAGRDLIQEIPASRWKISAWFDNDRNAENKSYSKWGGFIKDVDNFDPSFFGISKRQAIWIDPQLRLLLQSVQETFEDAGVINSIIGSKTGVFVGSCFHEYWDEIVRAQTSFVDYQAHSAAMSSLSGMISYFFDLQGGSIPLDNACASSLTALYLGCQAIQSGECDQAIIAGANVLVSPLHYVYFSRLQALSPTGRCHTFDKKADGYVPGEGIVSILIKSLQKALQDGDNIHAVIKGTAINHVGRSNNPYSPRPELQTRLLQDVWEKAGISPRQISYLEAHGTGTKLGDPIEINALKAAFKPYTSDSGFCAIGSAKAHVGHLEGAAGLASLVKVILMMKNQKIPKMPNFTEINPYIKIEDSPFFINTETIDWKMVGGEPRLAGVSSFGMTGNNAHVVVEEYIPHRENDAISIDVNSLELIPLSAKNHERLIACAEQLLIFIETIYNNASPQLSLADMAHTLSIGRQAMSHRVIFLVNHLDALKIKLKLFVEGKNKIEHCCKGVVTEESITPHFDSQDIYEKTVKLWFETNALERIAELWVQGLPLKSKKYYVNNNAKIISLPSYPFLKERFWIPVVDPLESHPLEKDNKILHPLVHENISELNTHQYRSQFSGDEFFFSDHRIVEDKVLPGVAYLEMAHAAAVLMATKTVVKLNDIVWLSPIRLNTQSKEVIIRLAWQGEILKFIICENEHAGSINCQGSIIFSEIPLQNINKRAILEIQKRCTREMTSKYVYDSFKNKDLNYGSTFQAIEKIWSNANESLAFFHLTDSLKSEFNQFYLHPSIMDAALQSTVGLSVHLPVETQNATYLPFAIKSLSIHTNRLPLHGYAYAYFRPDTPSNHSLLKCDIEILDESGQVCVTIHEFVAKLLPVSKTDSHAKTQPVLNTTIGNSVEQFLINCVRKILQVEKESIYIDEEMSAYGLDSITLTELANLTSREYGIELAPTIFFEYPTLAAFRDYLIEEYQNIFCQKYNETNITCTPVSEVAPYQSTDVISSPEAIVIVGMSGKFPMADNLDEYWKNLISGRDCITEIPKERWDWRAIDGDPKNDINKTNIKFGGFINGIDQFDPLFFGISPLEAELMDPQQRLLLEHVWGAIADAGYAPKDLSGSRTAVFIGTASTGYQQRVFAGSVPIEGYSSMGIVPSVGPNRISFLLNLHGPSEPIETACSSSLVAIHRGVQAIKAGECDQVIVGGVNTLLSPEVHISFSKAGMLSEDGRCKTFSSEANGYGRGEGVGILIIKKLSDALKNNDHIYAIIKSSSENHGGRANSLTAPNANAQAELLKMAYQRANIDITTIGYIETHGTGTSLGDPVEINGLKKAFVSLYAEQKINIIQKHCGLGSVKSNIGHAELAAGIAGVIKVLLSMRHGELPPTIHCDNINPYIQLDNSPFYIVQKRQSWQRLQDPAGNNLPRRAGVSSFGFGGVNAHIVLEEFIPMTSKPYRVSLPPFPFARESYWLQSKVTQVETNSLRQDNMQDTDQQSVIYAMNQWHKKPRHRIVQNDVNKKIDTVLLIDIDEKFANNLTTDERLLIHQVAAQPVNEIFIYCFDKIKSIFEYKSQYPQQLLVIVKHDLKKGYEYASLAGLIKTAQKENPHFTGKIISIADMTHLDEVIQDERKFHDSVVEIQYNEKMVREIKVLKEVSAVYSVDTHAWITSGITIGGVYWITGGLGKLGIQLAKHLVKTNGITIILSGRSVLNEQSAIILQDLRQLGCVVDYIKTDISQKEDVIQAYQLIKTRYGKITGIIHSAGIIKDAVILNKTHQAINNVLAPKIQGLLNIDEVTQYEVMDFIVVFSSIAGCFGNVGQADYAGANAFLDAYTIYRNELVQAGLRKGKTIAIAWPLWKEGGMQVSQSTVEWMTRTTGLVPMDTIIGLHAFDMALNTPLEHLLVLPGDISAIPQLLPIETEKKNFEHGQLKVKTIAYLKKNLAAQLKLPVHRIDEKDALEKYGIDSVMIIALSNELDKIFGALPKTLFFEYQTLDELAEYFIAHHVDQLIHLLGFEANINKTTLLVSSENSLEKPMVLLSNNKSNQCADIAIIGMSGKYPQAEDLDIFWENLKAGRDCITEIPSSRWDYQRYHTNKWGGFIEGVDQFDPLFFNISPREAELMDPQERLFLQCAWSALEDSGYTRERLSNKEIAGKVGVYVGVMYEEYQLHGVGEMENGHVMGLTGNPASIANRVSYICNLQGPSMSVDTMCSSSLTTIHLACESLRAGHVKMALAGGVNLSIHPNKYIMLNQSNFLSSQGRCESFGKGGDGYVPSEGVGCIVLKPLAQAIQDNDHIYGVIKATAINHGGKTNGYTVPNPKAQATVISDALDEAHIDPRMISYIEAHGTGTSLGDPIEINGLSRAFQKNTDEKQYCAIGSVKSNIGHCESAAGVAAISKVLLQLKHKQLVPSIHAAELNANIDFANTPFKVQRELTAWERPMIAGREYPRLAGISSFGAGGSNAHIIIEEYTAPSDSAIAQDEPQLPQLIVLSAKNETQLKVYAQKILGHLNKTNVSFSDIAYTLQMGREAMKYRIAFVMSSVEEVKNILAQYVDSNQSGDSEYYLGSVLDDKENIELFNSDPDLIETTTKWIREKRLKKLASLWVKGLSVDWKKLHSNSTHKHILLPTYPFMQNRYWIPESSSKRMLNNAIQEFDHDEDTDWLLLILEKINKNILFICENDIYQNAISSVMHEINTVLSDENPSCVLQFHIIQHSGVRLGYIDVKANVVIIITDEIRNFSQVLRTITDHVNHGDVIEWCIAYDSTKQSPDFFNTVMKSHNILKPDDKIIPIAVDFINNDIGKVNAVIHKWLLSNDASSAEMPVIHINDKPDVNNKHPEMYFLEKVWKRNAIFSVITEKLLGNCIILSNPENQSFINWNNFATWFNGEVAILSDISDFNEQMLINFEPILYLIDFSDFYKDSRNYDDDKLNKFLLYQKLVSAFRPLNILYVTNGLQSFNNMNMSLAGAKFAGLVKMLSAEYDHVKAKHIDFNHFAIELDKLKNILLDEFDTPLAESEIIYRDNQRYTAVMEHKLVNYHDKDKMNQVFPIYDNGVYVISGGTNGIGLELSGYLALRGAKNLVLMGITPIPDQSLWHQSIKDPSLPVYTKDKLARLIALTKQGIKIFIYTGQLTECQAMRSYFDQIRNEFGPIRGVIHSAGAMQVLQNSQYAFVKKNSRSIYDVISPKIDGIENLHAIFAHDALDFFVSFSSTAGQIPLFMRGMSDYSAANAYIDYFSQYQYNQGNRYYRSIAWVGWNDIGSHIADNEIAKISEKSAANWGLLFNNKTQGIKLFEAVMLSKNDGVNFLPCLLDTPTFIYKQPKLLFASQQSIRREFKEEQKENLFETLVKILRSGKNEVFENLFEKIDIDKLSAEQIEILSDLVSNNQRSNIIVKASTAISPHSFNNLNICLQEELSKILKIEPHDLKTQDNFQEYGLDSITGTQFSMAIEKRLNIEVSPKWLIDYPSLELLAKKISDEQRKVTA